MLVDDIPYNILGLEMMLKRFPNIVNIEKASNGEEAV